MVWRPGSENPADYLSRHAIPFSKITKTQQQELDEFEKYVWLVQYSPYVDAVSIDQIIKETKTDPALVELTTQIHRGFIAK